jgi:ABC-type proline/glycine betaine transport system ATPase subunit
MVSHAKNNTASSFRNWADGFDHEGARGGAGSAFLDELFSALDYEMTLLMRNQLQRVLGESKTTTLFASHDLEEAVYLADKLPVLIRRLSLQTIPPSLCQSRAHPQRLFTRSSRQSRRARWKVSRRHPRKGARSDRLHEPALIVIDQGRKS